LVWARLEVKSTIRILSILSLGLCYGGSHGEPRQRLARRRAWFATALTLSRWGMPSTSFHLLSFVMSMTPFEGEVGFRPQDRRPRGKHHRGQSVLLPCCCCGGGERAPALCLPREGRLKLPSPLDAMGNCSVESSVMARYEVDAPRRVEPMKAAPSLPLLGERLRPPK
jgi:hypothetical protein